jgi:predicted ester cyclase
MSLKDNKSLFNRFGEALNTRNFDAVRELLAPDFVRHCQATPDVVIKSREQFIEYLKMDDATFPDSVQTPEIVVAEGDLVAFWLKYEGTQKGKMGPFQPSNKRMQLDVAGIFRVRNGKFAELWITWDNLASLAQLGHFPSKSL